MDIQEDFLNMQIAYEKTALFAVTAHMRNSKLSLINQSLCLAPVI